MSDAAIRFRPLPPQRSLPETIAERIVEAIGSGHLQPGERIVELKLAAELGVSRGPLREALKVLETRQLVESRHGRGTFVTQASEDDLLQMVMLRANLEGFAARFIATSLTPDLDKALADLLDAGRIAAGEGRTSDWRDLDWQFHEMVVAGANNPFLLSAWRSIGHLVWLFLHTHPVFVVAVQDTLANHDILFAALRSGDPDRAEAAFRQVILQSAYRRFGREAPAATRSKDEPGSGAAAQRGSVPDAASTIKAGRRRRDESADVIPARTRGRAASARGGA